jgi:hypothetical protein
MQQLVILLVIKCSSKCFGRLYAHPQEVRLRFHCLSCPVLSCPVVAVVMLESWLANCVE